MSVDKIEINIPVDPVLIKLLTASESDPQLRDITETLLNSGQLFEMPRMHGLVMPMQISEKALSLYYKYVELT